MVEESGLVIERTSLMSTFGVKTRVFLLWLIK